MKNIRFKLKNTVIILLVITTLLAGCGNTAASNLDNKAEELQKQTPEETELTLSKALPEYKIWYCFDESTVAKDDTPLSVFYFDGENTEKYYLSSRAGSLLTIAELLEMSEEEQLQYVRSVVADLPNENMLKYKTVPYHVNIVTDGSGNRTDYEEVTVSLDKYNIHGEKYSYTKQSGKIRALPHYTAEIYDHKLAGYAEEELLLLTSIGDEPVSFILDSPKDESEIVSVDGDVPRESEEADGEG